MKRFADFLKEWEVYVDDEGYAHDDEGNVEYVGTRTGTGTFGLHDYPYRGMPGSSRRRKGKITDLKGVIAYAKKMGVSKEDAERYWKEMKGKIPGILSRIKFKAKNK